MNETQKECRKRLYRFLELMEDTLSENGTILDKFSENMSKGDVKFLEFQLKFGPACYNYKGVKVSFKDANEQYCIEVLAPDEVFEFYGLAEVKDEKFTL
eukprot:CAMPEP_0113889064 /NCGR_PEP_ID=MMETSP0780_2-20120614/13258_1 /TAXON_ID=652834 /ORGANISM="Palpitomonas bilix" /LENGTH=98 /DNA_ID=CAMNT_0000878059 /DNA_START=266 /DNA_END=563 /DNA_ORIENTATION=- /assembly_acc=CAM_ASM_000599